MANLTETADFPAGIYQIEQTDPVVGGAPNEGTKAGLVNIPHQQLARRTNWLKARVDDLVGKVVDGTATVAGLLRLSTAVNSTATDRAATPSAVKQAYDNADTRALKATTISAGSGLTGGGSLAADRTLSVDATVVRTAGVQTIAGMKRFERLSVGGEIVPYTGTHANAQVNGFVRTGNVYLHSHVDDDAMQEVAPGGSSFLMRRQTDGRLAYATVSGIVWTDADAARSRAGNGYERLPSGLIVQWRTIVVGANQTEASASFPLTFPSACLRVWAYRETVSLPTTNDLTTMIADSTSTFTLRTLSYAAARQFSIFAIGY